MAQGSADVGDSGQAKSFVHDTLLLAANSQIRARSVALLRWLWQHGRELLVTYMVKSVTSPWRYSGASQEGAAGQRYRDHTDCPHGATACCGVADVRPPTPTPRQGSLLAHIGGATGSKLDRIRGRFLSTCNYELRYGCSTQHSARSINKPPTGQIQIRYCT